MRPNPPINVAEGTSGRLWNELTLLDSYPIHGFRYDLMLHPMTQVLEARMAKPTSRTHEQILALQLQDNQSSRTQLCDP